MQEQVIAKAVKPVSKKTEVSAIDAFVAEVKGTVIARAPNTALVVREDGIICAVTNANFLIGDSKSGGSDFIGKLHGKEFPSELGNISCNFNLYTPKVKELATRQK